MSGASFDIPWSSVLPVASALAAVWLTSHLNSRRNRNERVWEARRIAYTAVISCMLILEDAISESLRAMRRRGRVDDEDTNVVLVALAKAQEAYAANVLFLSPPAQASFTRLSEAIGEPPPGFDLDTLLAARARVEQLVSVARGEIERIARSELGM